MVTGSILSDVKLQALNAKWLQKKDDIHNRKSLHELSAQERVLANYQEQMKEVRESNSHADLYNKLKSGGSLSSEEITYLEKNDPEALRRYREDQAEKKNYEKELKNCKTKEDVDRIKMNKLGQFATQAKQISNDPYIPLDKKLELMNQLNDKLCRVNDAHLEFINSKKYKDMPTEEELALERANQREKTDEDLQNLTTETENEIIENDEKVSSESPEEKLKKAQRESGQYQEQNKEEGLSVESVTIEIRNFVSSVAVFDNKLDISL